MKTSKLLGKRGFAVFTTLALCAGLVGPSFAATFTELQTVIDTKQSLYAKDDDGNDTEKIRIGYSDDTKTVTLYEDVTRTGLENAKSILIGADAEVTIDLNGQKIDGNKDSQDDSGRDMAGSVIKVTGGNLTIQDSTAEYDADGNQISAGNGQITGGSSGSNAGGILIEEGSVTLNSGTITGNTAKACGGGVGVGKNGKTPENPTAFFTMNGGKITGNTAGNNTSDGGGGGVWVKNGAQFTMNGGEITGNTVIDNDGQGNGGGVAIHQAGFTMNGGTISNNESPRGTGVLINAGDKGGGDASFTMNGGYVSGKDGASCIYMEESNGKDATLTLTGKAVLDGSIFLGAGAQVITDSVKQPDGTHNYTSFIVDGSPENTIGPDDTEKGRTGGYKADKDTLLDIQYEHEWQGEWSPDTDSEGKDLGTHSHSCKHCSEKNGTKEHNWVKDQTGKVTREPTKTEKGVKTFTDMCRDCGASKTRTEEIDFKDKGDDGSGGSITIDSPEVPLAGLFTRADAIGYLWEQSGSPDAELSSFEDVPGDHQWAVAIGWAQEAGIALADAEGNFRPDDLVLRSSDETEGEFQEFLNRYAVFAGVELDEGELFTELEGEPDDVIMGEDAQAIFDAFFAKLEAALAQAA